MKPNSKALSVAAVVGLLIAPHGLLAQSAPVSTAPTAPATATTQPAASLLEIVPADAWAVLAVNDLRALDADVVQLSTKLGLMPVPFAPSGLLQLALGVSQDINLAGSVGAILLDATKFSQIRGWSILEAPPLPIVLAIATTDVVPLLQVLGAMPSQETKIWQVTLLRQSAFAASKAGFVFFSPDLDVLKAILAEGFGSGAKTYKASLTKPMSEACDGADAYLAVSIKPIVKAYLPVLRTIVSQQMVAVQAAQAQPPDKQAATVLYQMASTLAYMDVLAEQLDDLAVVANLGSQGLNLSFLLSFEPDSLLAKICASAKPTEKTLLAGLPAGQFILAFGQKPFGQRYIERLSEALTQPVIETFKKSGNPELVALAEQQAKCAAVQAEMASLQEDARWAIYRLPTGQQGLLASAIVLRSEAPAKLYKLIEQSAVDQVALMVAQQPQLKPFFDSAVYTTEAETVGQTKVHNLLLDLTRIIEHAKMSTDDAAVLIAVVKLLFGSEGLKVRIALTDRDIVATLGGGIEFLSQVLAVAKTDATPLSKAPAIVEAAARLPKKRVAEAYLAVDSSLTLMLEIIKQIIGGEMLAKVPSMNVALASSLSFDQAGLRCDLHIPIEAAVALKNVAAQIIMDQLTQPSMPTRPSRPVPLPAPEF